MPGEAVSAADGRSNSCACRLPRPRNRNETLPLTCLSYLLSFPSHCALSASCTQSLATRARLGVHSEKSSETGQKYSTPSRDSKIIFQGGWGVFFVLFPLRCFHRSCVFLAEQAQKVPTVTTGNRCANEGPPRPHPGFTKVCGDGDHYNHMLCTYLDDVVKLNEDPAHILPACAFFERLRKTIWLK